MVKCFMVSAKLLLHCGHNSHMPGGALVIYNQSLITTLPTPRHKNREKHKTVITKFTFVIKY